MAPERTPEMTAALAAARRWRADLATRPIPATQPVGAGRARLPQSLPEQGMTAVEVVEELVDVVEPGLLTIGSPRFFGWVMGGTLPAALGADWLVSAWDQNAGMRDATPGVVAVEEVAGQWLLEALDLPSSSAVGFVTGCTTANLAGLAAARDALLAARGWDVATQGVQGAPRLRVLVGAERHGSVDLALRYLGLGAPTPVAADAQGRMDPDALRAALETEDSPTVVCAQAGNIHSGAFDPFAPICAAAHDAGAWVHVDGAFGLWAAASPALRHLVAGLADADSWATDAHKTLSTPYDSGVAVVRDAGALRRAFGHSADYLLHSQEPDPHELVPEMSRRARGVPVWAALRSLGRSGLVDLVDRLVRSARGLAMGLAEVPGLTVLNDVVYTQVTVAATDDETTLAVLDRLHEDGLVYPSASRWHDRAVMRFSVSGYATDDVAVAQTIRTVWEAVEAVTVGEG
nr:aminotransferase class V-fold PLP-dependent enzyme [Janibacter melonis]